MRGFIVMTLLLASFPVAAEGDFVETRLLELDAGGLDALRIAAGAGSLDVRGVEGQDTIKVRATIVVPRADDEDGPRIVSKEVTLSLERDGDVALLESRFEQRIWGFGANGRVDLEVTAPSALVVDIDDGSGSMDVSNFDADVRIDDGSGSIDVRSVRGLHIDDGSGSIDVIDARGDVYINDGSGSISVERVGGSVTIDDGSGSIQVDSVEKDLVILDAGSGSVRFSGIRGTVEQEG